MINLRDYARGDDVTDVSAGIIQALQDAAASGDMLYWPKDKGAYMCGFTVPLPSDVTILAEAGATVKPLARNEENVLVFSTSGQSNIKMLGLTIDGNLADPATSGNNVVQFYECHDVTIEGCTFQNTRGIALQLSTTIVNFRIQNNRFLNMGNPDENNDHETIVLSEGTPGSSRSLIVSDNIFDHVGKGCLSIQNTWDVIITGNISRISRAGFLYTLPGDCRRFMIVGNESYAGPTDDEPYANGLDLVNLFESTIVGNTMCNNSAAGIGLFNCADISVVGNVCNNNHLQPSAILNAGIFIRNDLGTSARITLSGNTCSDTQPVKTQGYGLLYDPNIPDLIIDESNVFAGNAIAEIGLINSDPIAVVSTDTITRAKFRHISVTWDIPSTASLGTAINDLTFSGLNWNDIVIVTPSGYYGIVAAQVMAPNSLRLLYGNTTSSTQNPPSQIFQITAIRF